MCMTGAPGLKIFSISGVACHACERCTQKYQNPKCLWCSAPIVSGHAHAYKPTCRSATADWSFECLVCTAQGERLARSYTQSMNKMG
jgi:hypothetical protein